eukprot:UN31331
MFRNYIHFMVNVPNGPSITVRKIAVIKSEVGGQRQQPHTDISQEVLKERRQNNKMSCPIILMIPVEFGMTIYYNAQVDVSLEENMTEYQIWPESKPSKFHVVDQMKELRLYKNNSLLLP